MSDQQYLTHAQYLASRFPNWVGVSEAYQWCFKYQVSREDIFSAIKENPHALLQAIRNDVPIYRKDKV